MTADDSWITFFTLLTVGANFATLALWSLALFAVVGPARTLWARVRDSLGESGLQIAAVVAVTAMAGSLYLSEGAHFTPCLLCWYQRAAMYPLAVILVAIPRPPSEPPCRTWSCSPIAALAQGPAARAGPEPVQLCTIQMFGAATHSIAGNFLQPRASDEEHQTLTSFVGRRLLSTFPATGRPSRILCSPSYS